jgi:hypothetical protein
MVIFVKNSCDDGAVAVASGVNTVNKMQMGRIRVEVHCEGRPIMLWKSCLRRTLGIAKLWRSDLVKDERCNNGDTHTT